MVARDTFQLRSSRLDGKGRHRNTRLEYRRTKRVGTGTNASKGGDLNASSADAAAESRLRPIIKCAIRPRQL